MSQQRTRLDDALLDDDRPSASRGADARFFPPRLRRRRKAKSHAADRATIVDLIRILPSFAKLLVRLARDPRVSKVDKALVVATIGYLAMPMDLIPDAIPFFGQLDDLYLLALVLDRLLNNAGMDVLLDHWDGDPHGLEIAVGALDKAGAFLPAPIRKLLRQRVG
jgi:uncharacterized membrane protein YkvA (DUF1232 family)